MAVMADRMRYGLFLWRSLCVWLLFFSTLWDGLYGVLNAPENDQSTSGSSDEKGSSFGDDFGFRWQVKLRSLGALRCSGVLIDTSWVLTAASCFDGNYQRRNYNADLYSFDTNSPHLPESDNATLPPTTAVTNSSDLGARHYHDLSIHVQLFYLHGRYQLGSTRHDIALVQLNNNVTSSFIPADVIGTGDDVNSDTCLTVGWGSNGTGEPVEPRVRRWSVMNSTRCSRHYNVTVPPDQLCAELLGSSTGTCAGDRGAPLVCRTKRVWKITGIVTETWRCHDYEKNPKPARFLNVQTFLPFVDKRGHFKDLPSGNFPPEPGQSTS